MPRHVRSVAARRSRRIVGPAKNARPRCLVRPLDERLNCFMACAKLSNPPRRPRSAHWKGTSGPIESLATYLEKYWRRCSLD